MQRSGRSMILRITMTLLALVYGAAAVSLADVSAADPITHRFLACGSQTYIMEEDGSKSWTYPSGTRDGYVTSDDAVVLTLNRSNQYPGGAVVMVSGDGAEKLIWKGTQSEINSAQPLADGGFVLTEAGENPRLIELDQDGKVRREFALSCQKENHHMQTRMARKLEDGTYLAPHLLNFAVHHYAADGSLKGKLDTTLPGDEEHKIHTWPFTAIRHQNEQTLVCCTHGNRVMNFNGSGEVIWMLTNEDLPGEWLQDPCGAQVLPNGNYVITSYAAGRKDPNAPKMIEVTPEKEVVWTYRDGQGHGVHHFQILSTNGKRLTGPILK